jgi:hypothetical protein
VSIRIEDLLPEVQPKARTFLSLIPIPHVVTSTLRTEAEQVALFAQGREPLESVNAKRAAAGMRLIKEAENKYTVTRCDGIIHKSNHQGGRALDVVPAGAGGNPIWPPGSDPRWEMIGKAGEEAGFEWGGRWDDPDLPHHEILV